MNALLVTKLTRLFWHLTHFGPRIANAIGLGPWIGRFILLFTTIGRKTSLPGVNPLTFKDRGETILVASARGSSADWYRNILAHSVVGVCLGRRSLTGIARWVTDPEATAEYLERQLSRDPTALGAILRIKGLPFNPGYDDLVRFAPNRPMVEIRPVRGGAGQLDGSDLPAGGK